jgi:tight adherence protein C
MPPSMLYASLFVLTMVACFTLYRAIWDEGAPIGARLSGRGAIKQRLAEGLSAVVEHAIERWPAGQSTSSFERKLPATLAYAGLRGPRAIALFQLTRVALMIGLGLFGIIFGASLGKSLIAAGALGLLTGYAIPTYFVKRRATQRQRRIKTELPDILALLVVSLEAGVGFGEAVKLVGREAERQGRILGRELSTTAAHMSAGRSMEHSLKDLADRNGVEEIRALAALAIQSQKAGAQIAPALRASAELLNSQRRLAAEEAAHKASVKMLVPLVFLILPAMLLIVLGPAALQILRMFSQMK